MLQVPAPYYGGSVSALLSTRPQMGVASLCPGPRSLFMEHPHDSWAAVTPMATTKDPSPPGCPAPLWPPLGEQGSMRHLLTLRRPRTLIKALMSDMVSAQLPGGSQGVTSSGHT